MAAYEKRKDHLFDEKEHLHFTKLLINLMYDDKGDFSFLEEIKIKLSGRDSISERQKNILIKLSEESSKNYYRDAEKKWEINRVGKLITNNIGDFLILIIFRNNLEHKYNIPSSEWDYFWEKSAELLKKDRESVGITDNSSWRTPKDIK